MSETSKKPQKLASAIYLITDFFVADEPLKWKLRTLALDLASERVKDKIGIIREIFALFAVATNSNLISQVNFEILQREFGKFEKEMESPLNQMFFAPTEDVERISAPVEKYEVVKDKTKEVVKEAPTEVLIKPQLKEFGAVNVKRNSRQNAIISLLKRKKEIMIKDISTIIDGCSEKTIQRELLAMVSTGVLKKIGEKRWSRYTLA